MISTIAKVYWRSIKRGTRAFAALSDALKAEIRQLAADEADSGAITAKQYEAFIGEPMK